MQWNKWLQTWEEEEGIRNGDAELFVSILNTSGVCGNGGGRKMVSSRWASEELLLSHPKYEQLLETTTRVCNKLRLFQPRKVIRLYLHFLQSYFGAIYVAHYITRTFCRHSKHCHLL